jgi:hypothetical protein
MAEEQGAAANSAAAGKASQGEVTAKNDFSGRVEKFLLISAIQRHRGTYAETVLLHPDSPSLTYLDPFRLAKLHDFQPHPH